MTNKKRCNVCIKEISSSNWSKHIKSKIHQDCQQREPLEHQQRQTVHCWIFNVEIDQNTWLDHLKSSSHKKFTKIFKSNLPKMTNKRKFESYNFETDDYLVKKSEEALEGCFLTLKVEP